LVDKEVYCIIKKTYYNLILFACTSHSYSSIGLKYKVSVYFPYKIGTVGNLPDQTEIVNFIENNPWFSPPSGVATRVLLCSWQSSYGRYR